MRLAFAGSPAAAIGPLRALAASDHDVTVVVTQPDRPVGRSGSARPTPVAATAEELRIPVIRPKSINAEEAIASIAASGAEALCVVAFGQILRAGILDRWLCLNVHFSLLPAYRGAAPVERALMDGVDRTGVTIMEMDPGMDTGPIIGAAAIAVGPEETGGEVTSRLSALGAPMLVAAVDDLAAGRLRSTPQPEEGISMAPKITAADRGLDPARPARELADLVRALAPHIGATCVIDGRPFKVWTARPLGRDVAPGLSAEEGGRLMMGTADEGLELLELQPPGRTRMPAATFLRGYRGALALGQAT
jgi:methionyl-tRNA formyltransferase